MKAIYRTHFEVRGNSPGSHLSDAARSDTIWNQATARVKKSGAQVTLAVLQDLLKQLLKQSLGLP